MLKPKQLHTRRASRNRASIRRLSDRPRLSIFRSSEHIYAQIIDDAKGVTLAAASTVEKDLRAKLKTGADKEAAKQVGLALASRAKAKGVSAVVFDRGGYVYHGRVQALAEGAREGGLDF